ncbi:uncharacterized protein KQ657_002158 [Scheffersomyces spartinae]|uniref:DUS-like FMN-binding domain-containing protein n=1 Tax=Scheffersomyces spartinae TaxID=45513 RepID=A0A9P7VE30_9ASCO|nr:uncharacterized protein KQ657_002158 [Scheffersomyces spartinae]KAG7195773.1 hypothetical protein KQ657_002158 [Scheffersomyces spartinae]
MFRQLYAGKLCLAPMVRSGELPTRLLALKYGCDLVWSPEIVDKKMIQCRRVENSELETVDFIEPKADRVVLRTYPKMERDRLIFQIGTASPELAVEAAKLVINDVAGIDLNCGCPKPFLTHLGMGQRLLSNPELLTAILNALYDKVGKPNNKPISCKIRLMDSVTESLQLIETICRDTKISNLTIHCRERTMRNRELPIKSYLKEIIAIGDKYGINIIINGAVLNRNQFEQLQKYLDNYTIGAMIGEAAESNPTVFSKLPKGFKQVTKEFLEYCVKFDNQPLNSKYILLNQIPPKVPSHKSFLSSKSHEEMLTLVEGLDDQEGSKILIKTLQKPKLFTPQEFEAKESFLNIDEFENIHKDIDRSQIQGKGKKNNNNKKQQNKGNENEFNVDSRKRSIETNDPTVKKVRAQ